MKVYRSEQGMALLFVLMIIALLSAMILEVSYDTLVDLRLSETFRDRTQAGYLARGGVVAGQMFLREDSKEFDAYTELWAQGLPSYPVDEGAISIQIDDLGGKLDVNRLVTAQGNPDAFFRDRFERLFSSLESSESQALTESLIDWLDPDSDEQAYGAESDYYQQLSHSYACKNGPLDTLDELLLIKGFDSELLEKLKPHITLHGGAKININTATAEVLSSLGENLPLTEAQEVVGSVREDPLTSEQQLQEMLGNESWYAEVRPYLQVKSDTFRIRSEGAVNDAVRFATAEINRNTNRVFYLRLE